MLGQTADARAVLERLLPLSNEAVPVWMLSVRRLPTHRLFTHG